MATDIQREYDRLLAERDKINAIRPDAQGAYVVDGKRLNVQEYQNLKSEAQKKLDAASTKLKKEKGSASKTKESINSLKKQRNEQRELIRVLTTAVNQSTTIPLADGSYVQKTWTPEEIADIQNDIDNANKKIEEFDKQIQGATPTAAMAGANIALAQEKGGPVTPRKSNKANATKPLPQGIAGPVLATGTGGAAGGTGRATGGAAGTGRGGKGGKGGKVAAPPANWEAKFREFFPSQSWLIDIDPVQYPGLRKLLQEAVVGQMWSSPEGQARFASQLDGTDFYTFLRDNQVVRTINTSVGDLGFDSTNFNKFVTSAANFGWTGDRLKQETYREAFRKNDDGTYANSTARQRVVASNDYKRIEGIARAYFNPISEDMVAKTLTGEMSTDDVDRQQRELAKTKYAHLGGLLDQGFTMSDLTQPYQKIAGNLLEKDPNTVDMTNTDFEAAYNYTDESGNKRLLTSGEWQRMIKSDAKYGWQNTDNAKQSAQRLALSIAQSFGRLM